jgi:hypothetical protein
LIEFEQCESPHRNPDHVGERYPPIVELQSLQISAHIWWKMSVYLSTLVVAHVMLSLFTMRVKDNFTPRICGDTG